MWHPRGTQHSQSNLHSVRFEGNDKWNSPLKIHDDETTWHRSTCLGKGGFGECFAYVCKRTSKRVAFKVIAHREMRGRNEKSTDREISIHSVLDHERIVKLYYGLEFENITIIKLELCARNSLRTHLNESGHIPYYEACYYVRKVLEGLVYLHEQMGIVHRDIKLDNILLTDELHVKIADFGVAAFVDKCRTTICGTLAYMAPEILPEKDHSFEVDIWSTGCMFHFLLVGQTFAMLEVTRRSADDELHFSSEVPEETRLLLKMMLQENPKARPTAKQALAMKPFTEAKSLFEAQRNANHNRGTTACVLDSQLPFPWRLSAKTTSVISLLNVLDKARTVAERILTEEHRANSFKEGGDFIDPPQEFWVTNWADFSDSFGLVYEISEVIIWFNFLDGTRILCKEKEASKMVYFDKNNNGYEIDLLKLTKQHSLMKKVTTLKRCREYLRNKDWNGNMFEKMHFNKVIPVDKIPYVDEWAIIENLHVFFLSDSTIQVSDPVTKMTYLLHSSWNHVTMINRKRKCRQYPYDQLEQRCSQQVYEFLKVITESFGDLKRENLREERRTENTYSTRYAALNSLWS